MYKRQVYYNGLFSHYDSYLPQRHATHFDVYVHEDGPNEWVLQKEIDTGLTPGMQRKVNQALHKRWKLENELDRELNAAGIITYYDSGDKTYVSVQKHREQMLARGMSQETLDRIFS